MKKLLIFSIFLLSFHSLFGQIKVSELSATPVDVLNNFYFKGGSLNGKYKFSLEKIMVNDLPDELNLNIYHWKILDYFTGINEELYNYTSSESNYVFYNGFSRVPKLVPTLLDKTELNIFRGSNDMEAILELKNLIGGYQVDFPEKNKLIVPSSFDSISSSIEIIRDKLVEISQVSGAKGYYLLNTTSKLNNIGVKSIEFFLANEKVTPLGEELSSSQGELNLNENDFLWRLFNINNEVYVVLSFRDVRQLNMAFPSFFDIINHRFDDNFKDGWDMSYFTSKTFYLSPKYQNIANKVFLEPRFCLFFFKLKAVN
jgi:hypothetical protein